MTKTLRAAVWAAVSSREQAKDDKISIPDQLRLGREKASALGATVALELLVPGESRELLDFPTACDEIAAYEELRQAVIGKRIDLLIFYNRGRLGRTISLVEGAARFCLVNGVALYDLSSPPATLDADEQLHSNADQLNGVIQSWRFQNELSELRRNSRKGMSARVERGEMPNLIPYGYLKVFDLHGRSSVIVDESAATIIRKIFDLYLGGLGWLEIARQLNAQGYRAPKGGEWTVSSVATVIDNSWKLAGFVEYNRLSAKRAYMRVQGRHEPIISAELAQRIQTERRARVAARRAVNSQYLFSRVVMCGQCGHAMRISHFERHRTRRDGTEVHEEFTAIRCVRCRRSIQERDMLATFKQWLEDATAGRMVALQANAVDLTEIARGAQKLDTEIAALGRRQTRLDEAFADEAMTLEAYTVQSRRLTANRGELERRRNELTAQANDARLHEQRSAQIALALDVITELLDHAPTQKVNAWLREFFTIIYREDGAVDILIL